MDTITNILKAVGSEESSVLANDIANFERSLALVRYQLYMYKYDINKVLYRNG